MLDLFAGRGGASKAMTDRGWDVVKVELDDRFDADHRDVRSFHPDPSLAWDLVWASPPCTEFSREAMPWLHTGNVPDMELVQEAVRVVTEANPRFWVVENVQGARKWFKAVLGDPKMRCGPVYLWGELPPGLLPQVGPYKQKSSGRRSDLRSMIPYEVSYAIARGVERAPV